MIGFKFSENTEKLQDRLQCLRYLATHTVEVGLTSTASGRSRTLLAIHEHGSPAMHIPARPVVKPALAKPSVRAEMGQAMMNACAAALDGDLSGVTAALEESGRAGVDGIPQWSRLPTGEIAPFRLTSPLSRLPPLAVKKRFARWSIPDSCITTLILRSGKSEFPGRIQCSSGTNQTSISDCSGFSKRPSSFCSRPSST